MSAIVEQSSATSKEFDYKQLKFNHPTYSFSKILPLSGTSSVVINTNAGGAQGNQEILMELPTKAFNPYESVLSYKIVVPSQGGNSSSWIPADTFSEISQLELYSRSGQFLARIEDLANYLKVVRPKETPLNEFQTYEQADGLMPCNCLKAENVLSVSTLGSFVTSSKSYTEQLYNNISVAATAQTIYRDLKLGYVLNSFFSLNKSIIFPEVLVLRVVFNVAKFGWKAVSANSATDPVSGHTVLTGDISVSNINLMLAVEQNQLVIDSLVEKMRNGFNFTIPFVYRYKNNVTGESQNVSIRLNRGHGVSCKKIIHALFNGTETNETMYDHSNIGANTATASKVTTYYTMLDNNRIQQVSLNCSLNDGDDYLFNKKMLKGSVIQNGQIYSYNWFHCDSFENQLSPNDSLPVDKDNLITGIDLSIDRKWDFVGQTTIAGPWNHYTFVCVEKQLQITPTLITIV